MKLIFAITLAALTGTVFVFEFAVYAAVLVMLQLGGFLQASDISGRYVHLGLWVMIAMAPAFIVISWFLPHRARPR
jgi:hypothetical protein